MVIDDKRVPQQYDKRRKLEPEDRAEIERLYKAGGVSQRQLARRYGVSRRLIQFYAMPEKHEEQKEKYKERQQRGDHESQNSAKKRRDYMRVHRAHKRELIRNGGIT